MRRPAFVPRALATVAIAWCLPIALVVPAVRAGADPAPPVGGPAPDDGSGAASAAPQAPAASTAVPPTAPVVRQVGEISVTAARSERSLLDVPGNVTVIDRKAIEQSGARDVPELLRREAGIFVTNDTGNAEGYRVEARGFNNGGGNGSSLLVLMDGRRLNEPDSSFVDWSLVHLDRVERIEIVRGPANTLYGDNATAGVIHIITRSGEGAPQAILHGLAASYGTLDGSLFAGGSHGDWTGSLYVEGDTSDGYRHHSSIDSHVFQGHVIWTPTDVASFELSSGYSADDRNRPGTLTKDEIDLYGRRAAEPHTQKPLSTNERFVQGRGEVQLAEGVVLTMLPYWRARRDDGAFNDYSALVSDPTGTPSTFFFSTDSWNRGGTAQVEVSRPVASFGNHLIAGGDYLYETTSRSAAGGSAYGTFTSDTSVHRRIWSLFLQDELSILPNLILSGGVRFDDSHYFGHQDSVSSGFADETDLVQSHHLWSPKAALTWRFVPTTSAYASYEHGFRLPNFDEAIGFTGDLFDLRPQISDSYEVGLKHRGRALAANLAFYWMNVYNEIFLDPLVYDEQIGFVSPQNVNLDRVRHRGIEAWANWQARRWLELYASYTFDDTQIEKDPITHLEGEQMPITPRSRGTAGFVVTLPHAVEFGANANVVGERPVANDLVHDVTSLDPYFTVDLILAWRPRLSEHCDVAFEFRVRNLTDKQYSEFAAEPTFGAGPIGYDPAPDRHFEGGVTLTWKP